jgi:hypothetical protein
VSEPVSAFSVSSIVGPKLISPLISVLVVF